MRLILNMTFKLKHLFIQIYCRLPTMLRKFIEVQNILVESDFFMFLMLRYVGPFFNATMI